MQSLIDFQLVNPLEMTSAGRPVLYQQPEEEIEISTATQIALYNEESEISGYGNVAITLTTIRLLITPLTNTSSSTVKPFYFELKLLKNVEKRNKLFGSPRIALHFLNTTSASSNEHQHQQPKYVLLSFRKGGRDEFLTQLETQLKRKNWIVFDRANRSTLMSSPHSSSSSSLASSSYSSNTPTPTTHTPSYTTTTTHTPSPYTTTHTTTSTPTVMFETRSAGLSGIIQNVEQQNKRTEQQLNEAFSDLNSLMDKAREMVDLAEKFAEKLKKSNEKSSSASSSSDHQAESDEMDNMLVNLGLSSIVTKQSAGNLFHQQLARQLAEFLPVHLRKNQGIMALSDAFCLYNRARGTDLISPDDMYRACCLFDRLNLPLVLKKFESSGVIVIQDSEMTDERMAERIVRLIESDEEYREQQCVSAVDVAHSLKISVILAQQQLLSAESTGVLCRDESIEGVRFYLTRICFPTA